MNRFALSTLIIAGYVVPVFAQTQPGVGPGMGPGMGMGAQNFDNLVVATPEHVAGNVYNVVGGIIVNMAFSAGEDGILMVDSNFADLTEKIMVAMREVSEQPIRFLIDTHSHRDHAEGNANFAESGALIFAHHAVRDRLANPSRGEPAAPTALPVFTFSDRLSFHFNGEEIEAFHVAAGHTDEDVMVWFKGSDVIHMGDVFVGHYPIIDPSREGTYLGLLESLNAAIALIGPDTRVIPGHGSVGSRGDVIVFRDMLEEIHSRVEALVEEGMSLDEVIAAGPTADLDERWAGPQGASGIVTAAWRSASGQ